MDLTKQNQQSSGQRMTSDEYRRNLQDDTISFLIKEKKYEILEFIGRGSYGDVFSVLNPNYEEAVALKIVDCNDVWRGEVFLWPALKHQNLLPLLEIVKMPRVYLFITPLMNTDLENFLEEDYFLNIPEALELVKKWLKEVLVALSYLHQQELCHLDVKADNVLLDHKLSAVLCDFSFICGTRTFVERYGVPMPYRPPEACLTYEKDIPVDGEKFEMWSYGMLAFNIFTGHILKKRLAEETKNWHRDIYPLVYEAMQLHNFYTLMFNAFPRSPISDEEMSNALNFLHFLLRLEPGDRPSVKSCTEHIFLMGGGYVMDKPEKHWVFQDLSDCKCPCLDEVHQTLKIQVKKFFPRYKFKKVSPKKGTRRYKQVKKWRKHAGDTKMQKLVIPESGDTGDKAFKTPLNKSYEDCDSYAPQLEKQELTSGSNADKNSNEYGSQATPQICADVDSRPFDLVDQQSEEKIVIMESWNGNKLKDNEQILDFHEDRVPVNNYLSSKVVVTPVYETAELSSSMMNQSAIFESAELMSAEGKLSTESEKAELLGTEGRKSASLGSVELRNTTAKQSRKFTNAQRGKKINFFRASKIRKDFASLFKCCTKTAED